MNDNLYAWKLYHRSYNICSENDIFLILRNHIHIRIDKVMSLFENLYIVSISSIYVIFSLYSYT